MNTILNQPNRRRVSTDRLKNREDSQLAASREGESGPTPAGKTLLHSYHTSKTRFRRVVQSKKEEEKKHKARTTKRV